MLIALIELVEAEARALRKATIQTGFALGLLVFAGILAAAGMGLIGWALYQFLATRFSASAAALLVGLLAVAIGGGMLWQIRRSYR